MEVKDVNHEGDVIDPVEALKRANAKVEIAEGHTQPRGELEARLRKPGAKGTLVEMANGDVVYVPTVQYSTEYYTADDGDIDARYLLKANLHPALCELLKQEAAAQDPSTLPQRFWVRKVFHILKENYPDLTPTDMNAWVGDIGPENPVVARIAMAFMSLGKN